MATIRKMPSGRWQVIIRKAGHRPLYNTLRTKGQAQEWARRKEDEIESGVAANRVAETMTVAELLETYERKITPRKASARKEASRIRILTEHLGYLTLSVLAPSHVVDYVDDRLTEVGSDAVRKELQTLGHAIDTGMALWNVQLAQNPVVVARRILSVTKTLKPGQERIRRIAPEEEARLLEALAAAPQMRQLVAFALETGLRRSELCRARWEHIVGDTLRVAVTKTDKARVVPLSKRARQVLAELPRHADGFLFHSRPDSITQAFSRACRRAGLEDLRVHDLRHEATSRFFELGMSIPEVATITGHTQWASLKRYTHVLPEHIAAKLG